MKSYCAKCHSDDPEGDVRFDTLASLSKDARLDALARAEEQLLLRQMPPDDARQPAEEHRQFLVAWMTSELKKNNAPTFEDRMKMPEFGNRLDHAKLFSGEIKAKPYTPARRWLVSPQIFTERLLESFNLDDNKKLTAKSLVGIVNPFNLPERSGVLYYDNDTVDGGFLLTMQSDASWMADRVVGSLRIKLGEPKEKVFPNKKDQLVLTHTKYGKDKTPLMGPFETIVGKATQPTDEELKAAIQFQFNRVLQRPATDNELKNYLALTRAMVSVGGNTQGLQKMLLTVFLESEFVYRQEFGSGPADAYGRRMLSPREASYAIAYALSDKKPDDALVKAAAEGHLNNKKDYEREVRRLLSGNTLEGVIDPTLGDKDDGYSGTNYSSQPKLVRFFREFFGYPLATRVFKDTERSDGYYDNPGRGTKGTPGHFVREADLFVDTCLKKDKNVFENLLLSDEYYVAPRDNAQVSINSLNAVYDRFKDINWHFPLGNKNPDIKLTEEEAKFVEKNLGYRAGPRQLVAAMTHVDHFRKLGLQPNPVWSYAFGIHKLMPHARSYNISPPEWQYAVQQPFKVEHRKGILTHPAWLIAHSQNSATDPVRRGKWVREKLLAGSVPKVPITVDAVIPEDPHKTLRDRLAMATNKQECWKCHQHMNPLGLAFEMYDDFGRFRTLENLEHPDNIIKKATAKYGADTYKTAPLISTGKLTGTGDPKLDGDVKDALDLIDRLAKSPRVRQSIIRHAFRFFMGRNEMLTDSQTLMEADQAYVKSGGSFKEVVVSLLTSDSFMYRK